MDTFYLFESGLGFGNSQKSFKAHCREQGMNKADLMNFSSKKWCDWNIMRLSFPLIAHKVALEELEKLDCKTCSECHSIIETMISNGTALILMLVLGYIWFTLKIIQCLCILWFQICLWFSRWIPS